jgi:predicted Zn-dependent protease
MKQIPSINWRSNWQRCRRFLPWLAVLLAACATVRNPVTGQHELTVMDEREEIATGQKQHQEVLQDYPAVRDAALQAYVNDIGQKLARASQRAELEWHFTVVDSTEVNAFALPGGYVYVTRGILAYLDNEAELAGVIGHEIGHVTARHASQRATRAQVAGVGVLIANVLGSVLESKGYGGIGNVTGQVSQMAAAGYIAAYSRDQESQADQLGAEYLAKNNYDSARMIDVIRMLKNQEIFAADMARKAGRPAPQGGNWLASHPSSEQRLNDIRATALALQKLGATVGRERYLQAIKGMVFGENEDQGVVRGQTFFHVPLGFAVTAPRGWRVQNSMQELTFINAAGDAALAMRAVPEKAGKTHVEILRTAFNPINGRTAQTTINGFPATYFIGAARVQSGGVQDVDATVITGPQQKNYLFLHLAKNAEVLQRERDTLLGAEKTFRALTEQDKALARPWRLKIVPLPAGGFAQLAKQAPAQLPNAEAQLRLLNGVYPDGEIKPGTLVKTVE